MNSWYCGSETEVKFCAKDFADANECNFDVWHGKLSGGAGNIQNSRIGYHLHNGTSSLILKPYSVEEAGAVTLFSNSDCSGYSSAFHWVSTDGYDTYYSAARLEEVGIREDTAGSIMVPEGYQAILYVDDDQEGTEEVIQGEYIPNTDHKMTCQQLVNTGTTSSLVVRKIPQN